MKLSDKQKAIHIIRCIAVLLTIAFWIFLFAWADEKYLIKNSFPDREPLFTLFGFSVYDIRNRFGWMLEYQCGRYFLTGMFYSVIIFSATQYFIKKFFLPQTGKRFPT